jgi:ABC-type uncharacterized transport system involved in gliding motility auxiliary subunit
MSRWGKILFFVAFLAMAIVFAVRYVLGSWIDPLYFPLALSIVALAVAVFLEMKFFLEFFTMRTTKHGLNMGTMILLVLAGLISVNFLAVRKNKVVDITEDKLHSLAPQTTEVLKGLGKPVEFTIFYRGDKSRDAMGPLRESLRLYQDASGKVTVQFYDSYVENIKAQDYLNTLPDKDSANNKVFVFVEYEGKRERVNAPFSETEITSAIVKATRSSTKVIYFLSGHGERDLMSEGEEGVRGLKDEMERYAAKVEPLNLLQNPTIPSDTSALVIAGPKAPLMDNEIDLILTYLRSGGRLLVLADPGEQHNLQKLLRPIGVEFANTFILNVGVQVQGASQVTAVGLDFDQSSDITKPFVNGNTFALFHVASEVRKQSSPPPDVTVTELLRTSPKTITINELSETAKRGELRAYVLGVLSKGKLKGKDGKLAEREFVTVVFGDSDFATNKLIGLPTNLNLILNSVAHLSGEADLISVRPRQPKSTKLVMTNAVWLGVVGAGVLMPTALMILGSVIWFRRRSA